jgi:hypothetical protein
MEQIRCDLAGNVGHLSDDAKTLTDYRYYVRQHPWLTLGAAATAGFLAIPRKAKQLNYVSPDPEILAALLKKNQLVVQTKAEATPKRSLLATGASLLAAAAMRAALSYAKKQAVDRLANFGQTKETRNVHNPTMYPPQPR